MVNVSLARQLKVTLPVPDTTVSLMLRMASVPMSVKSNSCLSPQVSPTVYQIAYSKDGLTTMRSSVHATACLSRWAALIARSAAFAPFLLVGSIYIRTKPSSRARSFLTRCAAIFLPMKLG
ncbi:hypothetical protein IP68_13770 [Blastomonas sp. AAP25]|nr:hypothetical protein IP68_13770 [Blastomonas sp. AAP25]